MKQLIDLIMTHPTTSSMIAYWIGSSVVSSLPSPQSQTSFYRFVFNFLHTLAGSIGRISPALRIPGPNTTDVVIAPPAQNEVTK